MRRLRAIGMLGLALLGGGLATAQAGMASEAGAQSAAEVTITGERSAEGNAMAMRLAGMAKTYWAARGRGCEQTRWMLASITATDEQGGESEAAGAATGCDESGHATIWLSAALVGEAQSERTRAGHGGDSMREELCKTAMHEFGHATGLGHFGRGLMSETGGGELGTCTRWRKGLDRRAAAGRKRLRQMSG